MTHPNHDLARRFFAALSAGALPDDLLTDDMTAWTTTSGVHSEKARYQGGVKLLSLVFAEGPTYTLDSITAEDDRVAVEARVAGVLSDGEAYTNTYVFLLRVREGRIASVAEHFNPGPVREKLGPLLAAVMAKAQA